MTFAYLVARNGQWRYDMDANAWSTLPSSRPPLISAGATPYSGGTSGAILGHFLYMLLEDGKLYRALFSETDLAWEGPLAGGWSFLDMPRTFHARAYQIASVFDEAWIFGSDHQILVYSPDEDAFVDTLTVPSPLSADDVTNVGLVWDKGRRVYAMEGSNTTGDHAVYAYDLVLGIWFPVGDGVGPDALRPVSSLWFDGRVATMNAFGTLHLYDPAANAWTTHDLAPPLAFGAWMGRRDDQTLLLCGSTGITTLGLYSWTEAGGIAAHAAPTTLPNPPFGAMLSSLYLVPPVPPIPLSVFPTEVAVARQFEMVQVPRVRGAAAVESIYQTPSAQFRGLLTADADTDMRAQIEAILLWLGGPIQVEILPGRVCTAYVHEHTLDPKWTGVSDQILEFSFSLRIPDTLFFDYEGYGFHTP